MSRDRRRCRSRPGRRVDGEGAAGAVEGVGVDGGVLGGERSGNGAWGREMGVCHELAFDEVDLPAAPAGRLLGLYTEYLLHLHL